MVIDVIFTSPDPKGGSCEAMSSLCSLSVSDSQRVMWGHVITMQPVSVRHPKGHVRSCHHYATCQCQTLKGSCEVMSSLCSLSVSDSKGHVRSCHHYAACQCQTLKGSSEVMSSLCGPVGVRLSNPNVFKYLGLTTVHLFNQKNNNCEFQLW
jgi:hypothetical protein